MTLREHIQAKIQAAEAEAAALRQELADMESSMSNFVGVEVDQLKSWFEKLGKHLGL